VERALEQCRGGADALKLFFLSAHYRSPIDYNERDITQAFRRWDGWHHFLEVARSLPGGAEAAPPAETEGRRRFEAAMDADLNTPAALAAMDLLQAEGQHAFSQALPEVAAARQAGGTAVAGPATQRLQALAAELLRLGQVLGLFLDYAPLQLSDEVQRRLRERAEARGRRDFTRADEIRAWFAQQGLRLVDHDDGTTSVVRAS
jgi:cysteinyl-tRNA synthetase